MYEALIEERTEGPISHAGVDWKGGARKGRKSVSSSETEVQGLFDQSELNVRSIG